MEVFCYEFAWVCYGLGVNLHSFAMELLWMCTNLCGFAMIVYGSPMHCVCIWYEIAQFGYAFVMEQVVRRCKVCSNMEVFFMYSKRYCLLPIAQQRLLPIAYCLLPNFIAYCLLPIAYC